MFISPGGEFHNSRKWRLIVCIRVSEQSGQRAKRVYRITCSGAENQPGYVMSFVNTHEIDTKGKPEHTHASHTLRHSRIYIDNVFL